MNIHSRYTLWHPRPDQVGVSDQRPREIVIQLDEAFDVELWPGDDTHDAQVAWIGALEQALRSARQLMTDHREDDDGDQ